MGKLHGVETVDEQGAEGAESERGRKAWPAWAWWPLLLVLVYALSIGPAYRLRWMGVVPHEALVIYTPFGFLASVSPASGKVLNWYVHVVWRVPYTWRD